MYNKMTNEVDRAITVVIYYLYSVSHMQELREITQIYRLLCWIYLIKTLQVISRIMDSSWKDLWFLDNILVSLAVLLAREEIFTNQISIEIDDSVIVIFMSRTFMAGIFQQWKFKLKLKSITFVINKLNNIGWNIYFLNWLLPNLP